jgi:hypothetical protein
MYIIKSTGVRDGIKRENHTRWGIKIPNEETQVEDLTKFFPVGRSKENILTELKADPCVEIREVEKAKIVKEGKKEGNETNIKGIKK